jgi:predicted ArsR family transcriptional regulator
MTESSADRILFALKTRGPQSIGDLGERFSMTAEAARQQLVRLAEQELVEAVEHRNGKGRPRKLWRLTEAGDARFPDTHAQLTTDLIAAARAVFGEAGLDKLVAHRETESLAAYTAALAGSTSLEERVSALAAIREREGYMAEWRADGDGYMLVENHCPICSAAAVCQGFCRSELDIFRTVLGDDVSVERTDHILQGARRCAYRIRSV